ncbi:MAG: DUF2235 domain-containing protein [Campylobacterota bacterium]|nr:DUF2235 domain-containing protein [Campylobacterota bacterium]
MKRRIIICADGTWNTPEDENPTNIVKLSRAIKPVADDGTPQQVFYDWGIGSYHDSAVAGVSGKGLHKNIMDNYRYIVQNYSEGDEIYLFGFSRGAYTVRSLCGLINNCGILKRDDASLIKDAFNHYKKEGKQYKPDSKLSKKFRKQHSHKSRDIHFVGVWDTVGAMGIPISFLGLFEDKDEFYDRKLGKNIKTARHAIAIDEHRKDFKPTIWTPNQVSDLKQVWFAGAHSDIGGSYAPDNDGTVLSDISLKWMIDELKKSGLDTEPHLEENITYNPTATLHNSRRKFFRLKRKYYRKLTHGKGEVVLHESVKDRWDSDVEYRPKNLSKYVERFGWDSLV